jgi:hypothetical protein
MKKIALVLLIIFPLLTTSSCNDIRTLEINSPELGIENLVEDKLNVKDVYIRIFYSVSIKNETLYVEKHVGSPKSEIVAVDGGYYIGVDLGEFAGWVSYCPYMTYFNKDGIIVVSENCRGLIKIDKKRVLLLTGTSIDE